MSSIVRGPLSCSGCSERQQTNHRLDAMMDSSLGREERNSKYLLGCLIK